MRFVVNNKSQLGFWLTVIVRMELEDEEPVISLIVLSSLREIAPDSLRTGEIAFSEYLAPSDTKESDAVPDCETTMELQAVGNMPQLLVQSLMSEGADGFTLSLQISDPEEQPSYPLDEQLLLPGASDRPDEIVVHNTLSVSACVTVLENDGADLPFPGRAPCFRSLIVTSDQIPPGAYENSVLIMECKIPPGDQMIVDDLKHVDGMATMFENGFCHLAEELSETDGWRTLEIDIVPFVAPPARPIK